MRGTSWVAAVVGCFALVGPKPAGAHLYLLGDNDVFCEESLKEAEQTLLSAYNELEGVLEGLEKASLWRSHGAWIQFRDADCAFAGMERLDRNCCLQRLTEERIEALKLYLAQQKPTGFYSWKSSVPLGEKEQLKAFCESETPRYATPSMPDSFLRIGDGQYLVSFRNVPGTDKALQYVNLWRREGRVLERGTSKLIQVLRDTSGNKHILVEFTNDERRIRWRRYVALALKRSGTKLFAEAQPMLEFRADAGSDRCDPHSATFLKLKTAVIPKRIDFSDVNGDNVLDVTFHVVELECLSQQEAEHRVVFLATQEGFAAEHPEGQ